MAKYLAVLALWAPLAAAQPNAAPLTNNTIIQLVASGISTDALIKTIQAAKLVDFNFLPGDLALLQRYNVPADVVKAMAARSKAVPVVVPPATVPLSSKQTPV